MSASTPQLSRYEVLGRLATGGMAEVWLARALGAAGFEKLVVIKTILPHLAADPSFVTMFVNEGRLAARLNHANCVQIFDLGLENGSLYIAMEFVEGFALSRVLSRSKTKALPLDEKVVARIGMDAASGLDYAHRLTDRDGTPLHLVHRDVSPDNLLISFSGQTRLVDFGVAKAATPALLASATVAGTVKGKHGFIAPEYLLGAPIDGRADIFALGVVMYRALTRKRPFPGQNEAEVSLAVIQHTPTAPHVHNERISPALSDVVLTALAKDPAARYQTARDFRHAIEAAVGRPADVEEVGDFMLQLWPPGDDERTALSTLASGTEERSGPALKSVASGTWAGQNATPASAVVVQATPPTAEELSRQLLQQQQQSGRLAADEVSLTPGPSGAQLVQPPQSTPASVAVFDTPQFDPPRRAVSPLMAVLAVLALLVTGGLGWFALQQRARLQANAAAGAAPASAPTEAAPTEATVIVALPVAAHVLEGKDDLGASPLTFTRPAGPVTLRLINKALGLDQTVKLELVAGETKTLDSVGRGAVVVKADPWAYVKVDGKSYGQTPVTVRGLLEGPHVVELNNVGLNEQRRREVRVRGGETKTVSVRLLDDTDE